MFEKRAAASDSGLLSSLFSVGSAAVTAAGKKVNQSSSMKISAFYCAVTTLADSFAILPKSIYKADDKMRDRVPGHPINLVLTDEAHRFMTPYVFSFLMVVSMFIRGNAYAVILRDNAGRVVGLKYLDAAMVQVVKSDEKLFYRYKQAVFSADEILHIPGFCLDNGIVGRSIVHYAAESLGTPLAAQEFGATSYNDLGVSLGVLETDKALDPGPKERIKAAWNRALAEGNPHRAVVLDEGFKYKSIRLTPEQSKFIEAKTEGVADIARWFKMPLSMLHVKGEGGYNFMVQLRMQYLQDAFLPLAEKFKQEYKRKLLTPAERSGGLYMHFNYNKLLQVDPKTRSEFYRNLGTMKAITPNEIRALEDMNPLPDGDEPLQMVNMMTPTQFEKKESNE